MTDQENSSDSLGQLYREAMRSKFPPDPLHPIRTRLREAYFDRAARVVDAEFEFLQGMGDASQTPQLERFKCLLDEVNELAGWVFDPITPEEHDRLSGVQADFLQRFGLSFLEAKEYMERTSSSQRGRPVSKREVAVNAKELKMADPRQSWTTVARRLCTCGRAHTPDCKERIRQGVMELDKILIKYGIQVGPS